MAGDYPDWTDLVHIIGTDIMVAVDIQGGYIMLPIDIQGQYITLEMDIVAQTIGNITIDIAAQTIGDLEITINAQAVGIYLMPGWTALQGEDKDLDTAIVGLSAFTSSYGSYTVTAGKTLYITDVSFSIDANAAADGDKPQHGKIWLENDTDGQSLLWIGGDGGGGMPLSKPIKVASEKVLRIHGFNKANHDLNIYVSVKGFEI
jgi:hypothetical protein